MTARGERVAQVASYGGDVARCGLVAPASTDELADVLARASGAGRRITFRGGGCAFDTQSLNRDLVVSLDRLRGLRFSAGATRVAAGAGEPWGELVRAAHLRGRMPPVVVTTAFASVAGTTSGLCVSRWTPVHGPDGDHVHAVELVTARGRRLRLTRDDAALPAVTGGLGYLGAITSVELALRPHAHDQVETRLVAAGGIGEVLAACAPGALPAGGEVTAYGALLPDLRRGMAFQSRHVSGQARRPFRAVHQPRSALRLLGELLLVTHAGTRLVGEIAYRLRGERHVDSLVDYTFFMDGDTRFRRLGRRLGLALRLVQQSFAVPVAAGHELIERARRVFDAAAVVPMFSDVLYCPADRALLSATHGMAGFIVSFAFSPRTRGRLARIERALRQLSRDCRALGGRVRLTKHVHADPDDLAAMYSATLPRFHQLKRALDPDGAIRNEFLERVFPSLAGRPTP
ncbi:MAG: FAD-binding oxidoreductase [Deltaproteobacteria bacterium]|nr:MAG: FAD-binding oxidoreductase [Deltaproteobacteria bacterium]TMQ11790.1 MAG: FAD-binding oxidoreductase [Deltaproteobacteria bacterium]